MGSIPDPIFDQVSATTVAEFPKRGKSGATGMKGPKKTKAFVKKASPKRHGKKRI